MDLNKLTLMMLQKEIRTISKDGIRLHNRLYWAPELHSRRHPVLVRWDWQLSLHTVFVYDTNGDFICEARDRDHYHIASGIHPAARVLGTPEQQRSLAEAIELRNGQWREASADMKTITSDLLVEARQRQAIGEQLRSLPPAPQPEPKIRPLSATEKAAIEAAKAAGAQARAELDAPTYEPSIFKRFPDEPARYDYLFTALHERGAELVPEDAAFMAAFEESSVYQRNWKARYEMRLECLNRVAVRKLA